ncbi:MAG: hypothetical protein FWD90_07035 [Defluviitaleaceae bacterium]|nr:hypothetical protein [Defluviitaleaceae bacterium]
MKKKFIFILFTTILTGMLTLSACGGRDEALTGEWAWCEFSEVKLIFDEDGTGIRNWSSEVFEGYRWSTSGERLVINLDEVTQGQTRSERWTYTLSDNGNTLTIQSQHRDETDVIFTYYRVIYEPALAGMWEYLDEPVYYLDLNATGTGRRNWYTELDDYDPITWTASGGHRLFITDGYFYDRWTYRLSSDNNTLTLFNIDEPEVVYIYNRKR